MSLDDAIRRARQPVDLAPDKQADTADVTAVDREQFIGWVADRIVEMSQVKERGDALHLAESTLQFFEETDGPFGAEGYAWDRDAANTFADEEMFHWERGE